MATRVKSAPAGAAAAGVPVGPADRPSRTAAGDRARRRRAGRGLNPPNRSDAERPGVDRVGTDGRVGPRAGVVAVRPRRVVPVSRSCAQPEQPYRMGRAARLSTTLTVAAVAVLAAWSVFFGAGPSVQEIVVQSGDTVRSIAEQAQPGAPVDQVVAQILDLNALGGLEPLPGQLLQVPVQG